MAADGQIRMSRSGTRFAHLNLCRSSRWLKNPVSGLPDGSDAFAPIRPTRCLPFRPTGSSPGNGLASAPRRAYFLASGAALSAKGGDGTLQGSQDGTNWTDLDRRTGEAFPQRFQTKQYELNNSTAYGSYHGSPAGEAPGYRLATGTAAGSAPSNRRVMVGPRRRSDR